jgi:hypothetical protein
MSLEVLKSILLWCTAMNFAVLWIWFLMIAFAREPIYRLHGRWFPLAKERFDSIHYAGMLAYKVGLFLFNVVPCVALYIVT